MRAEQQGGAHDRLQPGATCATATAGHSGLRLRAADATTARGSSGAGGNISLLSFLAHAPLPGCLAGKERGCSCFRSGSEQLKWL